MSDCMQIDSLLLTAASSDASSVYFVKGMSECKYERADKQAGSAPVEDSISLDGPTVTTLVLENLVSRDVRSPIQWMC